MATRWKIDRSGFVNVYVDFGCAESLLTDHVLDIGRINRPSVPEEYQLALSILCHTVLMTYRLGIEQATLSYFTMYQDTPYHTYARKGPKVERRRVSDEAMTWAIGVLEKIDYVSRQPRYIEEGYMCHLKDTLIWYLNSTYDPLAHADNIIDLPNVNPGNHSWYALLHVHNINVKHSWHYQLASSGQTEPCGDVDVRKLIPIKAQSIRYRRELKPDRDLPGRVYSRCQNLRRVDRSSVLIDYTPTVELDFTSMSICELYAIVGDKIQGDAYQLDDQVALLYPRSVVKSVCTVLFNCSSRPACIFTLARSNIPLSVSEPIIDLLLAKHSTIQHLAFTKTSEVTQYCDGEIAIWVMCKFADLGKPIMNIHDSFRVKLEDRDLLYTLMADGFKHVLQCDWHPKIEQK